jgi:16S rRNA (cytidine1402-2'-O)-methyltransferase
LRDITIRALDVLKSVDIVAAEDTRQTHKLLSHHGIAAQMVAVHEHNERRAAEQIVRLLAGGKSVALVTDAGTPGLSDPGACAVAKARERGLRVVPLPGPSALTAAISVAALSGPRFLFAGFLPSRPAERRAALGGLAATADPIVFYEAPHRVAQTMRDMARILGGERRVVIARELTKVFEEIHECALDAAAAWLEDKQGRSRGEFVLVVGPACAAQAEEPQAPENVLRILLAQLPLKQAVALAAEITGTKRKALYQRALAWRQTDESEEVPISRPRRRRALKS